MEREEERERQEPERQVVRVRVSRYDELMAKRDREGLSDDEAKELGRLMAERQGREYANADDLPVPDVEPVPGDDRSFPGPKSEAGRVRER